MLGDWQVFFIRYELIKFHSEVDESRNIIRFKL